jgi:hypothetical protein
MAAAKAGETSGNGSKSLVVAPLFIYITIEALRMAWSQWFGQGARE